MKNGQEEASADRFRAHADELRDHLRTAAHNVLAGTANPLTVAKVMLAGATMLEICAPYVAPAVSVGDDDEEEKPRRPRAKPAAEKTANACTDGKRHKYGDDRKCTKCGAADPRAPKAPEVDARQTEVPGAA